MALRTYRVTFRKNWVCQPSKWNLFWENLQKDMEDILVEIEATSFSYSYMSLLSDNITKEAGKDNRITFPKL